MSGRASPIRVAQVPGGPLTYLIHAAPEALPPVRSADLADAWTAAREAASNAQWGSPRLFRFLRDDGDTVDLALDDDDACCWAAAVDQTTGLRTAYAMSLCLRLLALIDLLARSRELAAFYRLRRTGAALDPALVRVAASAELTSDASFDERQFRGRLAQSASPALTSTLMISGATP